MSQHNSFICLSENLNCEQIYTFILFFALIYHTGSKKAYKIALVRVEYHKGKKETCNWNVVRWFLNPFSFLDSFKNRIFPPKIPYILKITNDADGDISILGHLWLSTPQDGGFSGMIYNTVCRTCCFSLLLLFIFIIIIICFGFFMFVSVAYS